MPSRAESRRSGIARNWHGGRRRPAAGVCEVDGCVPELVRDHPIMTRRSRGREVALQVLYQVEQNPSIPLPEIRRFIQRRLLGDRKLCEFTEGLIAGVKQHHERIDALISEAAENWRIDRMAAIDRNILRLGVLEMMFSDEVPGRVAINEALELAKRYSTAQSSRFVNGILDRLLQSPMASARPLRDAESTAPGPEAAAAETESTPQPEVAHSDPEVAQDETPPE
jgi:N utilization substance protein B